MEVVLSTFIREYWEIRHDKGFVLVKISFEMHTILISSLAVQEYAIESTNQILIHWQKFDRKQKPMPEALFQVIVFNGVKTTRAGLVVS